MALVAIFSCTVDTTHSKLQPFQHYLVDIEANYCKLRSLVVGQSLSIVEKKVGHFLSAFEYSIKTDYYPFSSLFI